MPLMWPFTKTNRVFWNESTYTTFLKRFEDVESRIRRLELDQKDFADKVLRKIQTRRKQAATSISEDGDIVQKPGIIPPPKPEGA